MNILPPTPVTEINNTKRRVTTLEKRTFPPAAVDNKNVNVLFVGDTGEPGDDKSIECSLMRISDSMTIYGARIELQNPATKYFAFDVLLDNELVGVVQVPTGATHVKTFFDGVLVSSTRGLRIEGVIPTGQGFMTVQFVGTSNSVVNQTGLFRLVEL